MKYKVLITGKNDSAIDGFFTQMSDHFEVLGTSVRYEDMVGHMNYFVPDVFVCCLYKESQDHINKMASMKSRLSQIKAPFVVIGSGEDCGRFEAGAPRVSDLTLCLPLPTDVIQGEIHKLVQKTKLTGSIPGKTEIPARNINTVKPDTPVGNINAAKPNIPAASPNSAKPDAFAGGTEIAKPGISLRSEKKVITTSLINEARVSDQAYEELLSIMERQIGMQETNVNRRKHILIVDDDLMMLKLMKEYLHEKYDVATAVSGKIALKFLERKQTDLILLDYEMPGENGPAVLEKLRSSEETRNIPVIFLTGVTEGRKIQEALALKPQSYLLKPVQREKLLDAIRKIIE